MSLIRIDLIILEITVNLQTFAGVLFSQVRSFEKWWNHSVVYSTFNITNVSFNTFRENKILAKISKFIVIIHVIFVSLVKFY